MSKIPIPNCIQVIRPRYLVHRVVLNDGKGLFLNYLKQVNDLGNVTTEDVKQHFNLKKGLEEVKETLGKPYDFTVVV